jgi:hypothetical protein
MNQKIKDAIDAAVAAENQPPELSKRLVAWMESLTEGNEDITNQASYTQRSGLCFDTVVLPPITEE